MKLKNNLQKKINSLSQSHIDFFLSDFKEGFLNEINEVVRSSGLFKESYKQTENIKKDERWNIDFESDKQKFKKNQTDHWNHEEGLTLSIGVGGSDSFFHFTIFGLIIDEGEIEKGFFSSKHVFNGSGTEYCYHPFKSKHFSDYQGLSYPKDNIGFNELVEIIQSPYHNILNSSKEKKFLRDVNQKVYDYLNSIDERIKKSEVSKKTIKSKVKNLIKNEFDQNTDGILDIIEGDNLLIDILENNESVIIDFDHLVIQKIVRLNKYLLQKRKNLINVFEILKKVDKEDDLEEFSQIMRNSIENYQSILIHSMNMVLSIKEKKLIVYHEIYEMFDELGVFNSNWEKEVTEKLRTIDFKLEKVISSIKGLMYSIKSMEIKISNSVNNLTYTTKSSFQNLQSSLTTELKHIRRGVGLNNILTGIQTHQLYKINKNTKSLRD
jgi:hypothetical protein